MTSPRQSDIFASSARLPNPYLIYGPALISFSGGRSSGYMLKQIIDSHGGRLPDDVVVQFCNTGKELVETLDFVQECSERWSVHINWLEWRDKAIEGEEAGFEIVSHNQAARNGEPFKALVDKRGYLPNPVTSFCSIELKIRTAERFAKHHLGWKEWTSVVGLRADEMRRVGNQKARNETSKDAWETAMPMAEAGVTKRTVAAFWGAQSFDLRLPNVNGKTPLGNCDLCFKKGFKTIFGIIRDRPELADWWASAEEEISALAVVKGSQRSDDNRFRRDRPSYAEILQWTKDQGDMVCALDDDARPCACHD